jgi:hypothetical protein
MAGVTVKEAIESRLDWLDEATTLAMREDFEGVAEKVDDLPKRIGVRCSSWPSWPAPLTCLPFGTRWRMPSQSSSFRVSKATTSFFIEWPTRFSNVGSSYWTRG